MKGRDTKSFSRCNRRQLLQGATAAAALSALPAAAVAAPPRARQPNILFIMADDLGYADLSCYGRRDYKTPVLDRLAADGLLMTHGYANSSVCSPTRVALITGRYQHRLDVGLDEPLSRQGVGLDPRHPSLPSLLKKAGYRTALIGKWHLGSLPNFGPLKSGYDEFFGIGAGAVDYFTHKTLATAKESDLHEGETKIEKVGYLTNLLTDRAISEIKENAASGSPFLMSLHYTAPHWPWEGEGDEELASKLKSLYHLDGGTLEKYAEMVVHLDRSIGRVLQQLKRSGIADNTIVVFTSDNGGERFSDTWPFTGAKTQLLEGGIRVPVIVRWPDRIARGSRSDQVIASMDWLPTFLAAAGGTYDPQFPPDGENLLDVITGKAPRRDRKIYWRYKSDGQAAVREGPMKYLRLGGYEYLFDVTKDPRERANLREKESTTFERLKRDYAAWEATMLPYPANSRSLSDKGRIADRY